MQQLPVWRLCFPINHIFLIGASMAPSRRFHSLILRSGYLETLSIFLLIFRGIQGFDAVFWRDRLLGHFTRLLSGEYTPDERSNHVEFFSQWIIPLLGPKPQVINRRITPIFKSYMCDDHTPIELSLSWKTESSKPTLRYSIEPFPVGHPQTSNARIAYGAEILGGFFQGPRFRQSNFGSYLDLDLSLFTRILRTLEVCEGSPISPISSSDLTYCHVMLRQRPILSSIPPWIPRKSSI
ncbi:hypothetical protein K439DRAFT_246414 [Ramaria rubella]|nr:hypothetical protein K439DRAFT_246414 [Ramaria rubella]